MTWNLNADEVVKHWDLIKWGAYQVNKPPNPEKYFVGLLKSILEGNAQVWFSANGERQVKAMGITKIISNFGTPELLVDTLYGYAPMTPMEQKEGFDTLMKFARNMNLSTITAYASQPGVGALAQKIGMAKVNEVYKLGVR